MECRDARKFLVLYGGEDSPSSVPTDVVKHVENCPACRMLMDEIEGMWRLLDEYEAPETGNEFTLALIKRIRSSSANVEKPLVVAQRGPHRLKLWHVVSTLAAIMLIAVILGFVFIKPLFKAEVTQVTSQNPAEIANTAADEDLIYDLDVYENSEMLENMDLLRDFDVILDLDELNDEGNVKDGE